MFKMYQQLKRPSIMMMQFRSIYQSVSNAVRSSSRELPAENPLNSSEVAINNAATNLAMHIKLANSTYELFEIVSLKRKDFTSEHMMQVLRTLFQLQKNENTSIPTAHILKNADFENMCRSLKFSIKSLPLNDVIDALKILIFIGVPGDSVVCLNLLHTIRHQINDISLGHIIFLEYLLKKMEPTPLVEAFKIALPMLLQIQIGTKMDHENVAQLTELLLFVSRNKVSDQCAMNIVSALCMHGADLSVSEAKSILWSLCDIRPIAEPHEKLLANCLRVLEDQMDQMSFKDVELVLEKLIDKYGQQHCDGFYSEAFYGKCAEYCVNKNIPFMEAIYVQRKLNKISYINLPLLDFLTERIVQRPDLLINARPTVFFTYITALSTANYCPTKWSSTVKQFILRSDLIKIERTDLPWIKCALEMLSLDCSDPTMLNTIFSEDFLQSHMQRTNNTLDHLQLLMLAQAVETLTDNATTVRLNEFRRGKAIAMTTVKQNDENNQNCTALVERCFAAGAVKSKLKTKQGHCIDHVLIFNEMGEAVPIIGDTDVLQFVEDMPVPEGHCKMILLMLPKSHFGLNVPRLKGIFALRVQVLERLLRIPVCVINQQMWLELPDHEKQPYLQRETAYRLVGGKEYFFF